MKEELWRLAGSRFDRMTKVALAILVIGVALIPIVTYYLVLALLQVVVNVSWSISKFVEINWRN